MRMQVSKTLIVLLSVVLSVLLTEATLRFLNLPPQLNKKYQRKDIEWMEKNVVLNSAGYRDKEYPQKRSPDRLRIYTLGDSYTYGWLVDNPEYTYPKILESKLINSGKNVEVINAGNPGFSLPEMVNRFLNEGKYYYPDIVIVGINDDEANFSKTYQQPRDAKYNKFLKSLHLYQLTFGNYYRKISENLNHDYVLKIYTDEDSQEWKNFSGQLLKLKEETGKINADLIIVLYPHIHPNQPDQSYDYYPYNEKLKKFAKDNNISLVDPLEDFLNYKEKSQLVINPLDPHPTKEMNEMVADAFLKQFDLNQFMQKHKIFTPESTTISLTKDNLEINEYQLINNISSSSEGFPWVYFETKYDKDIQNFPLKDKSSRNSNIYLDSLQTAKSFTHSGIPGATISYHVFSKEDGKLIIPDTVYGYPVVGFTQVFALSILDDGSTVSDYIAPYSIKKDGDKFIISFEYPKKYYIFRVGLSVAVRQVDINPEGNIKNIITTNLFKTTNSGKTNKVEIPIDKKISSWAIFTQEPGKSYPYAFINGKLSRISEVIKQEDKLVLSFTRLLDKGDEIIFPAANEYSLSTDETINFVIN